MVALKSTSSRCPITTPLHHAALHYLSEGLIGSADLQKDVEQLQLLVRRVEVEQRDDEDGREILPSTILCEQQRSPYRTCVEVGEHTLLRLRKPGVGSAATRNCPKTARRAAQDRPPRRRWRRRSSCAHPTKPPFKPIPTMLRRLRGRATLLPGLIAPSETISAPLQGQHGQRCGGAPSSGTAGRLTGRARASA